MHDFKVAIRQLRKSPGFSALIILTLGLGIGANGMVFSAIKALLFPSIRAQDPERLVALAEHTNLRGREPISYANFQDWRQQNQVFESIAVVRGASFSLIASEGTARVRGFYVSSDYFHTLGVAPLMGRAFQPEEDRPGGDPVAMISDKFWRSHFHARAGVIGQPIKVNGEVRSIIGIAPDGLPLSRDSEVYLPLGPVAAGESRGEHNSLYGVARLRPGVTLDQARERMNTLAIWIAQQYPESEKGHGVEVRDLRHAMGAEARLPLVILQAIVAMVLLIACVNISNLLLVRMSSRNREAAIRSTLGATRGRLARQFFTETALLALGGGLLGCLLCAWGCDGLVALIGEPRVLPPGSLAPDETIFGLTMALAVLAGAGVALLPAYRGTRPAMLQMLKSGLGSGLTARMGWLSRSLAAAELAVALVLLVGTGLLTRTLYHMVAADPGMDTADVLTLQILATETRRTPEQEEVLQRRILEEIGALPGVRGVAAGSPVPFSHNSSGSTFHVEGRPMPPDGHYPHSRHHYVSHEYFQVLGLRFVAGRPFAQDAPGQVVINQTMARSIWPHDSALGRRIRIGRPEHQKPWQTVVGVVRDTKAYGFREPAAEIYFPSPGFEGLLVKGNLPGLEKAIRVRLAALDKDLVVYDVATLEGRLRNLCTSPRIMAVLSGLFGLVALGLAVLGIYGVMAHLMVRRTREIGIRMALGACPRQIARMALWQGLVVMGAGLIIGLAASLWLTRFMSSLLYGVSPADPPTLILMLFLLGGVTLLACWLPAQRAARLDPVEALRCE